MLLTTLFHLKNHFISYNGMRLEELNDDCLEYIFQQLPTKDQYTLWLTSPHFKSIIELIWLRKFAKHRKLSFRDPEADLDFGEHKNALVEFARVLRDSIEDLVLSETSQLLQLATIKWTKLRSLEANVRYHQDASIIEYAEQFPVVERLVLLFEDDHLTHGLRIQCRIAFRQCLLMELANCDKLIELRVDDDMAIGITRIIRRNKNCLRRLRKISACYYYDLLNDHMRYGEIPTVKRMLETLRETESFGDKLHTVGYNFMWNRRYDIIKAKELKNLRRLNIISFSERDLGLQEMPRLQELHFRCPKFGDTDYELTRLNEFIRYAGNCVRTQGSKRQCPLDIHCYVTEVNWARINDTINTANLPELIRLTYVRSPNEYENFPISQDISVECEWD